MVVEISEEGQQRVNIGKRDTTGYLWGDLGTLSRMSVALKTASNYKPKHCFPNSNKVAFVLKHNPLWQEKNNTFLVSLTK